MHITRAKTARKKRWESFDTYKRANIMGGIIRQDPRSGWAKIKTIGIAVTRNTLSNVQTLSRIVPTSERARMLAIMMQVQTFAASAGW